MSSSSSSVTAEDQIHTHTHTSMGSAEIEPMGRCHVVALPYPGRGHINPLINLCKLLVSRSSDDLLITFVVTEEWLSFIGSEPKPANIRFRTIPNVLPSELVRSADMPSFIDAVLTKMEEPFEQLLDRLEQPPSLIMADVFVPCAVNVGKRRNIPVAAICPTSVSVFSVFYHFDLLVHNQHYPFDVSERGDERVGYIPGISSIRLVDLPTIFYESEQLLYNAVEMISHVDKAQFLLFTSIFELEAHVFNALKAKMPIPMYSFGPLIPHFTLGDGASDQMASHNDTNYHKWLDSQPQGSVLYISMGSFLSVSSAQMDEIAAGLRASGLRFLWVACGEASRLTEACGDAGMVVPWCDQLKVLCHSSVGGFWSHCGWNSTMESVFAGVPMLTFPLLMDQVPISKTIVEDWRIGWRVMKREGRMENLVGREEIADLVRRFMDLESAERQEMTRRARELQKISRQAMVKGGSSEVNLSAFVRVISQLTRTLS
ncbi:UDP-glycosyltransferase 87A1-like [Cornus florida]|uniref:UDP-glycosyltransferase 87A1-like n=1 Tax=Cornus florida TaxID=4283 RepID=UPI002897A222|nr:UDP-glycosyltransferase 87A1-like [Cornus florida]